MLLYILPLSSTFYSSFYPCQVCSTLHFTLVKYVLLFILPLSSTFYSSFYPCQVRSTLHFTLVKYVLLFILPLSSTFYSSFYPCQVRSTLHCRYIGEDRANYTPQYENMYALFEWKEAEYEVTMVPSYHSNHGMVTKVTVFLIFDSVQLLKLFKTFHHVLSGRKASSNSVIVDYGGAVCNCYTNYTTHTRSN